LSILKRTTGDEVPKLEATLTGEQILELQELVRQVPVAEHVFVYARDLARATRPTEPDAAKFVKSYIAWGAGPRAGQYLVIGAKARAVLEGRLHVTTDDVQAVARPVLRHRLVTTFQAGSEGITADNLIDMLLDTVPVELVERAVSRVP
jgi:MoxR-like ATPase